MTLCRHHTSQAASTLYISTSCPLCIQLAPHPISILPSTTHLINRKHHVITPPPPTYPPPHHPHTHPPAFTALQDAYARWQHFEHPSALGPPSEHAPLPTPTPAPLAFIMACPYIDLPDLPEGDRTCPICNDPYHPLSQRARDPDLKVAQRLPCRHLLCDRCLATWLSPLDARNNNTCPFDRRVLFPKFPPFPTAEGTQRRVDLVDWLNGARGRRPEGAERDGTGALKAALVERRLGDAVGELEVDGFAAHALVQWGSGAGEVDAAALSAYRQQLQRFEHRLSTVGAIAESVQGHVPISTLRTRLQCLTERLARDRAKVQGMWDATNELGGGTGAVGSGRSR